MSFLNPMEFGGDYDLCGLAQNAFSTLRSSGEDNGRLLTETVRSFKTVDVPVRAEVDVED